ncbi:MAG: radical SAM protein [Phycisphaerae bacterium]|nr:radical SAM protein [Phycisphaerae bacterium]
MVATSGRHLGSTINHRLKVLHDVFQPRLEARGVPFEYVIEVSSRCNLSCPMCPRRISTTLGNSDMDLTTFHRALDRIRETASFIWLAGLGEPMMNKHFMRMIAECHEAGIATGASTNGTFLTDKWQEHLLDSRLDVLVVSFDGADKETYEKIRVGADFDRVFNNVRRFAARKVERSLGKPWLILQMLELSDTRSQVQAFRRMWSIPGVDAVRVKKDELQFDESLAFPGQRKRASKQPCLFLWRGTPLIQSDGSFVPCCYGAADKSFGNMQEATAKELWNSPRIREVRRSHLAGRSLEEPFCRNCNTFQPGKLPMAVSVLVPSLTQKKHSGIVERVNRHIRFME